ncbi:DNA cytosine methyltransferase [Paenibacillus amylolyticus]|uniref:DNA cytosine methyltransferase n=1 Tax=Paenibacillus amylolyticus TaxID=1451 RepID=UPI003EBDD790
MFIVGVRNDIGLTFEFPEPRPEDFRTQVLRDVIGDLPEPDNTENNNLKPIGEYAGFESRTRRKDMDDVSYTVDTRWDINYVHPQQPRRFTVRECLRIQSVPDTYVLPDSISLSAQYRIVGNGVASRVSYLIGVALAEQLNVALASENQSLPEVA